MQQRPLTHIEKLIAECKPNIMWLKGADSEHMFLSHEREGKVYTWHSRGADRTEAVLNMEGMLCKQQTKQ